MLLPSQSLGLDYYNVGGAVRCRRGEYRLEAYATLGAGNVRVHRLAYNGGVVAFKMGRLEKQLTDLRRRHHYMRDGALVFLAGIKRVSMASYGRLS